MTTTLTLPMLGLIAFCVLVETARELCFKHGATGNSFLRSLLRPIVWAGIALWVVELTTWTNVLARVPLGIAFPLTSLNYVIVLIGGAWLLGEKISRQHVVGALLITAGVALIGTTGM